MRRVKMFEAKKPVQLEQAINDFLLSDEDFELVTVKFNIVAPPGGITFRYFAVVIYNIDPR